MPFKPPSLPKGRSAHFYWGGGGLSRVSTRKVVPPVTSNYPGTTGNEQHSRRTPNFAENRKDNHRKTCFFWFKCQHSCEHCTLFDTDCGCTGFVTAASHSAAVRFHYPVACLSFKCSPCPSCARGVVVSLVFWSLMSVIHGPVPEGPNAAIVRSLLNRSAM